MEPNTPRSVHLQNAVLPDKEQSANALGIENASAESQEWTTIIDHRHSSFRFPWRELWAYRDLIYLFVRRDFVSTYKQTILGPLWYWAQPFLSTVVFTLIFSGVGKIPTDGIPPFLFYLSGIVCWSYFADCLVKTSSTFATNAHLFGKIYFPRFAVPLSTAVMSLVGFFIQFSMFLLFYAVFVLKGAHLHPSWKIIVLPVLVLQMALLGVGVGSLVSALTTRYKDLAVLVGFGTQLWMYASCIVYPLAEIPPQYKLALTLNPMVTIIESFRFVFFGAGTVELWQLLVGFFISILIFVIGLVTFNRVERTFTDTI